VIRALGLAALAVALAGCSRPTTAMAGRRMIVLGIDGMDPAFLEAHWDSLPNLDRLRKEGDFKRLGTTIPPQSPVAWSTVTTGMDPGGHGIFDFVHRDPATRAPMSSMAEVTAPTRTFTVGPYLIPLTAAGVRKFRKGQAFWSILAEQRVAATVIRMPANFPPDDCEAESLSGLGTPDLAGTYGTFTFFTDDPLETRSQVPGGQIVHVDLDGGRAILRIGGPANPLRKDHRTASVEVTAHVDPSAAAARFDRPEGQLVLREGEWSDWMHASFPLIPGIKSAAGMFRIYLQQVHPHLRVYVSPVNLDPVDPALPISTPSSYSRTLAGAVGPYFTQGIAEETAAYRAGIFSRAEFLAQSREVMAESLRMFRHELAGFSTGLMFYYFSSVDQNSHMLWGKYDAELLEIYRAMDEAVGEAMRKAGGDTTLLVLSDHGFAPFDRAVHLNTWLLREGFLALDNPVNTGAEEGFAHVDWSRTQAYALGLNAVYLNLKGRENQGIVAESERQRVCQRLAGRLLAFRDPARGENVVDQVDFPERAFRGRNLRYAPDLLVGFRRGYRASWETALGALPDWTLEDNTGAWIGDHCMASREVPGVLLSNRKIRAADPDLIDIAPTILREFGLPPGAGMIGRTLY
jgi:predicted AlkP superfamily phosphohydrolase/phosphomutase